MEGCTSVTNRPKVLIITDSIGFPRPAPDNVVYEETYIKLLKNKFPDFDIIHCGRGGATINELYDQSVYYLSLQPTLVFVQSGIVDCAPRAFSRSEEYFLPRIPFFGGHLHRVMRRYGRAIRNRRRIVWTPLSEFENFVDKFRKEFSTIYFLGIISAHDEFEKKSNGIQKNIEKYNKILKKGNFIDMSDVNYPVEILPDLHHPNDLGHRKIFEKLSEIIISLNI